MNELRWRRVIGFTPLPFYPKGKRPRWQPTGGLIDPIAISGALKKKTALLLLPGFKLGTVGVTALYPVHIPSQLSGFISIPPPPHRFH